MCYKQMCSMCKGSGKMPKANLARDVPLRPPEMGSWTICPHCNGSGREPEDYIVRVPVYRYEIHAS